MVIVTGYPRSRTKWFSEFLSTDTSKCLHEPIFESYVDLFRFIKDGIFNLSDSSLILVWEQIAQISKDIKFVLVKRDRAEVEKSLATIGLMIEPWALNMAEKHIEQLEKQKNCLTINFEDINSRYQEIFKFVHGYNCPIQNAELVSKNIQLSKDEIQAIIDKLPKEVNTQSNSKGEV